MSKKNRPVTKLYKIERKNGPNNRGFKVIFTPDPEFKDFDIEMNFAVVSVDRTHGEVIFQLKRNDNELRKLIKEDSNE